MEITLEKHKILFIRNCGRGKHRLRTNKFGVTWCTICGLLSNTENAESTSDDDQLIINCKCSSQEKSGVEDSCVVAT